MMQLLAMLTMAIDHIGIVFFPDSQIWRIIGRIAFPLYAFGIVQGFLFTSNRERYFRRLLWLAAISQVPFMIGLHLYEVNVIGTFAVCLAVLIGLDRTRNLLLQFAMIAAAGTFLELVPFDYGAYALLLVLIYRYVSRGSWTLFHAMLNVASWFILGWFLQLYSFIATVMLTLFNRKGFNVPRWLWRSFYPAHLSILGAVVTIKSAFY